MVPDIDLLLSLQELGFAGGKRLWESLAYAVQMVLFDGRLAYDELFALGIELDR